MDVVLGGKNYLQTPSHLAEFESRRLQKIGSNMRAEEEKEEEGGVVNPSRPWARWPIRLNERSGLLGRVQIPL